VRHSDKWPERLGGLVLLVERLRVPRRQWDSNRGLAIEGNLERELSRPGERNVEHEHGTRLDVDDTRWRLAEVHRSLAAEQLGAGVIHEADSDRVDADFRSPPSHPEHQMCPRVNRRKPADPHVLKDAEDRQLALLIDEGVIGENCKVDLQNSGHPDRVDHVIPLDPIHHVHALRHLSEDRVLAVEMPLRRVTDEKLAPAGVLARVGHRERSRDMLVGVEVGLAFDAVTRPAGAHSRVVRVAR